MSEVFLSNHANFYASYIFNPARDSKGFTLWGIIIQTGKSKDIDKSFVFTKATSWVVKSKH
tara:strand:- start:160280 stop:160462 length:183 start_codon:yes stop_codon:yes gene_type:complete